MTSYYKLVGEPQSAFRQLLKSLIEKGVCRSVLTLRRTKGGGAAYALLSKSDELENAVPLAPVMPVNAAKIVSDLTKVSGLLEPVAVVLRPCENRALIELVKLKQASLDNLILIGFDCPGTYKLDKYTEKAQKSDFVPEFLRTSFAAEDGDIREACKVCVHPIPANVDIAVCLAGCGEGQIFLQAQSDKGKEVLSKIGLGEESAPKERDLAVASLVERRKKALEEFIQKTKKEIGGFENLLSTLANCVNCHNCMSVCPVCYCRQCFFDSEMIEFEGDRYLSSARRKGALKMPADSILFHLTRANHIALSCVACGMCQDACPNDVPVFKIFCAVSHEAQKLFGYEPGRSLTEELPLAVFKEDEFQKIGT
jgi:formate dehydrogenase subunit beta